MKKTFISTFNTLLYISICVFISFNFFYSTAHAIPDDGNRADTNTFTPLVGIPGVTDSTQDLGGYANALYLLSISLAAMLAFLKIVLAGVKYVMTDIVVAKGDAKKDIEGALLGLLLIAGAALLLNTINPNLTSLDALNIDPIRVNGTQVKNFDNRKRQEEIKDNHDLYFEKTLRQKDGKVDEEDKQKKEVLCAKRENSKFEIIERIFPREGLKDQKRSIFVCYKEGQKTDI